MAIPQPNESRPNPSKENIIRKIKPSPRPIEPRISETEMVVKSPPTSPTADTWAPNPVIASNRSSAPTSTELPEFSSLTLHSRRPTIETERRYHAYLLTLTTPELCALAVAKVRHDRLTNAPEEPRKVPFPNFVCLWNALCERHPGVFIRDPFAADRERQARGEGVGVASEEANEPISPRTRPVIREEEEAEIEESAETAVERLWGYLLGRKE